MRQNSAFVGAAVILALSAATALAAPCAVGQTPGQTAQKDKSSRVEPNTTGNVSPGAKSESPGTVGALSGAAADRPTSAADVAKQQDGKPTAAQQADGC